MKRVSEVHAYVYILDELVNKKEWGRERIFTQQECRKIEAIKEALGLLTPENVVKVKEDVFYIIEAKNERKKINVALKEARNDYADKINKIGKVNALFISGIAGNYEEGFISKSQFFRGGKWETITENDVELTGLLSKKQINKILKENNPHIKEVEISDEEFLKAAEKINGILHEGGINKDYRARVMSALLLALIQGSELNLDEAPSVLIQSINSRIDVLLKKHKKSDFARFIKLDLPSSEDNHIKFKNGLVLTIQELLGLNIRSAMRSGKDVLGNFYEVFLKYGNGAKEIGIVLTPTHITKFAAEASDIQANDLVLDPTCGTGGFLVAAFDEVQRKTKGDNFEEFKKYGLFGIEQQDPIVALALVNMIFRGDGKNNIIEGDCFAKWLNTTTKESVQTAEYLFEEKDGRIPPITKVLMNPPFPKKKTDYKEYLFIEHALKQMQEGGLLFSVLPYSCMVKGGAYLSWRERLLKENTLLSVITFPEDLFYPVGVHTVGVFIKKGISHPKDQNVMWIRSLNDGRLKSKGKRLPNKKASNDLEKIKDDLKHFIINQSTKIKNIEEFQKACPIDFEDEILELIPENYLDEKIPSMEEIQRRTEQTIRDYVAYLIKSNMEDIYE